MLKNEILFAENAYMKNYLDYIIIHETFQNITEIKIVFIMT